MRKGIKEPAGVHALGPTSLSALIHHHVRAAIELAVREELRAALGTTPLRAQRNLTWLSQRDESSDALYVGANDEPEPAPRPVVQR
jgi:hypothetical protein